MIIFKEAEISIKFYRGIKPTSVDDDHQSSPMEQVKIEFESIKSLISEKTNGVERIALNDFCKNNASAI